ncbi:MAG: NHL repeat-containing protein [Coriobacteriia bacterium]|nr:NHL repeat-containing protein [Coriobacteriia bacterium]
MTETPAVAADLSQGSEKYKSRRGRRLFILLLLFLLILLGFASYFLLRLITPAGAPTQGDDLGGITWIRSIYGLSEAPEDQFNMVQSAVPGPDGSIWVNDADRRSVFQFTPQGQYVREESGPDDDPLVIPGRVAFGPDGLMYVTERQNDLVRVLDANGAEAGSFGIPSPFSIDVDEERIAVGTRFGFAILEKDGTPLQVIGAMGKGDDEFDYVHGIALGDNGIVYVVDSFNNRLSAYDSEGKRLWIVRTGLPTNQAEMVDDKLKIQTDAKPDLAEGDQLQLPMALTVDGAGRLVVVDMYECALAVFDPEDGSFIAKYGEFGAEDGKFLYPTGVAYDAERDWFTVADTMNSRAQIVRIPGSAGGNAAAAAVNRALSGPLRACLFPLLLLVLILIIWLVARVIRKRRHSGDTNAVLGADDESETPSITED